MKESSALNDECAEPSSNASSSGTTAAGETPAERYLQRLGKPTLSGWRRKKIRAVKKALWMIYGPLEKCGIDVEIRLISKSSKLPL